jgi:hypothetical protein
MSFVDCKLLPTSGIPIPKRRYLSGPCLQYNITGADYGIKSNCGALPDIYRNKCAILTGNSVVVVRHSDEGLR